jgi:hypothetical protein
VRIEKEQIKTALTQEVLKREVVEGEKADEARRRVARAAKRALRNAGSKQQRLADSPENVTETSALEPSDS